MEQEWMQRVCDVFDTNPRNGNSVSTVWLQRSSLERAFEGDLFIRGRHICIDGCSGSGKSSLVITSLLKNRIPYTTVQITRKMDWTSFCKQLISKTPGKNRESKATIGGEWKGLFPTGKLELSFSSRSDEKYDLELWEKTVSNATEHSIAEAIAKQNCIVLLDEFERAQPELANSVCEVCKILTQSYTSSLGKLIILGADDVYKKLYDAYSTLDNRLVHHSIPTLPSPRESWSYLKRGFEKLNKFHPGNSKFAKQDDEKEAMQMVYMAADGLLKSLTELGIEICKSTGPNARGISLQAIRKACESFDAKNFGKYRNKFSEIHRISTQNPVAAAVLIHINNHGLGQIHDRESIEENLKEFGRAQVEDAILMLWKHDFLVITGESNQKIFVKNPSWAHTLRIYLSDPSKKRKLESHLESPFQMALGIGVDWEKIEIEQFQQEGELHEN